MGGVKIPELQAQSELQPLSVGPASAHQLHYLSLICVPFVTVLHVTTRPIRNFSLLIAARGVEFVAVEGAFS